MSIRSRLFGWMLKPELAAIQARYEAAYWNLSRSYLPGYIQGAREDIDSMSRAEILRRVRYFEKNSNVMQKALSILSVNVIGTGINPTPATSDETWNDAACEWWKKWCEVADVTGASSLYELQDIVYRGQNIDGDHAVELTLNEFGRPAINLIESHRITSAGLDPKVISAQGFRATDGVIIGPSGKPLAYTIQNEFDQRSVAVIPASKLVLFYTKRRASQYRGISLFHSAILDLHDLDDLQKFEMKAAKDAASISKVVQTAAGAATVDGVGIGRSLQAIPAVSPTQKSEYYRSAIGGETIHTLPGDKYDQYTSERPSAATTGFWDKLENKFVQGSGLSYAALVDYRGNWGGATLRAAVTSDNRLFSLRTNEQARKWQRVWEYAIEWAMQHNELPFNPEFRNVRWHPPRRTTVDIGNESAATLNELKGGIRTYETIYGEAGDDWRERLEQRAVEEQFIDELAAKYKVDRYLIASFAQERMTTVGPDNADTTGMPGYMPPETKAKGSK
jgi:capsid protein